MRRETGETGSVREETTLRQRYVAMAVIAGISVPLLPFVAWLAGGTVLSPRAFAAFLAASFAYLGLIAAAAVVCAVRELSRFFSGCEIRHTSTMRSLLAPLVQVPPDSPIRPGPTGDEQA